MRVPGTRPRGNANLVDKVLPAVQDVVGDAPVIGDLIEIITGREDGTLGDIGSIFNGIFRGIASVASKVAAIEGKIATGAEYFSDFKLANSASSVGHGWTQGGDGQPLGISDQAAQITRGGAIAQPGRQWAKSPKDASGNDFTVSMVVHPLPSVSASAETALIARANAAFTEGVCVRMVRNKAWLCRFVRNGNTWTYIEIAPMSPKSYSPGAIVEFKGQEQVLQVLVNNVVILATEDTVHAVNADHRSNGMSQQTTTQLFGTFPEYSGGAASYSIKSQVTIEAVTATAQTVATKTVAPVAAAVTAGSTGAAKPADADTEVYNASKALADTAKAAQMTAVTTAIQLQQQQQNENVGAGGLNKVLTFASLSSTEWTYDPAVFSVANNQLVLSGNIPNGFWLIRPNYTFTTDSQAVFAQLGSEANNDQYTFLCLRATNGGAQGVACRVSANSVAIGTYSHNGSADGLTFNAVASVGRTNNTGDSIEFRAIGNNYAVLANGNSVLTFTGTLGSIGSSNRNAAVIKQKAQGAFGIVFFSFNLSSFGMYDFGAVGASATSRVNAKISRISNSTVSITLGNGGYAVMPTNYYSSTDSLVGMTVTDLNTGKIRVDTADWYEVEASFTARYFSNVGVGAAGKGDEWWGQSHFCLFVNDVQYTQALLCGVPHRFQFAAGDVIQVGIANVTVNVGPVANSGDGNYSVPRPANLTGIGGGPGSFFQISKSYQ